VIKTGGNWDPKDRPVIWLAAATSAVRTGDIPRSHDWALIAANEINNQKDIEFVENMIDNGCKLLLDSGVFWLTNEHKRKHGITMDEALSLAPTEIDNFDWLWDRYTNLVKKLGDKVWGYMELDQGGAVNKRITRQKLHDLGINPIPVWHPLNDGPEYFDELAENYDRICLGNIVQANVQTRTRLLHTLWEKHRKYPDLWVHVLGMNPSEVFNAVGIDSADASTWVAPVRWGSFPHQSMLDPFLEHMEPEWRSMYAADERLVEGQNDDIKILRASAISMSHAQIGWRDFYNRRAELLGDVVYPPINEKESK
jgi:hypothetical protein